MFYSIGKNTYWYEIHGTGEPLVLLHGFTGSSNTWADFTRDWQSDLQIITVDLPGHGKTDAPEISSMEEACWDLQQLFSHLNLKFFHLLGYSMGGRTALSYTMFYPEKVTSLMLESASPGLAAKEEQMERRERDERLAKRIEKEGVARFADFWEKIPLFDSQHKLAAEKKAAIRAERLAQHKTGLASSLRAMGTGSQPSWWEGLTELTVRTLLLAGQLDVKFTEINKKMHEHLQTSELTIIENAGHAIHVEQPAIFGKMVKEFIFNNQDT